MSITIQGCLAQRESLAKNEQKQLGFGAGQNQLSKQLRLTCSATLHDHSTMYDFCFTFPYSALLALGGLIGFVSKGSLPSLVGGLTSAGILAACAYASLASYRHGKTCRYCQAIGTFLSFLATVCVDA